ncbi:MAG: response regulator transcription factor [Nitrososphaeraceae archaeon]
MLLDDVSAGQSSAQQAKDYYPYIILHKLTSFCHYFSSSSSTTNQSYLQDQKPDTATVKEKETKDPFLKRILVVDDDPDITLTFKVGLEDDKSFEVYTYTDPLEALSRFRPHFYDLLLVDINMPKMNGFELCTMILKIDVNVRICFITAGDTNIEALREIYPTLSIGCFIKKPVTIEYLAKRLKAELD